MKLGKHFTLAELTVSQEATRRGIPNDPDAQSLANLQLLVRHVLDPLRDAVGPVHVSSGYRSPRVNKLINGASSSQHVQGEAADFTVPGMTTQQVVDRIRAMGLPVDQCIEEFSRWVHVSYSPRHRRQFLRARRNPAGKTMYEVIP